MVFIALSFHLTDVLLCYLILTLQTVFLFILQIEDKETLNNLDTSSSDFTILQVNCMSQEF